jgi:hypothetical protein
VRKTVRPGVIPGRANYQTRREEVAVSTIQDQLDKEFAPAWTPVAGDSIVGIVTDLSSREGEYGTYPIVTVRGDDGERALHCFHEVLANELARIAPKVGDQLGVKYVGRHPERGYHIYRVRRGGDESFDWGRFGDISGDPGPSAADDDIGF